MQLMMREASQLRRGNPMMQLMPQLLTLIADAIEAEQRKRRVVAKVEPMELASILLNMILGRFSARVYSSFICGQPAAADDDGADTNHISFAQIFSQTTPEKVQAEIDGATTLITTVFFNGVVR
jgi:hypothetical protein